MSTIIQIQNLLQCSCAGNLRENVDSFVCETCGRSFQLFDDAECLVCEEVYIPAEKSKNPISFSKKVYRKRGNWRLQNYKLSEQWIDSLGKDLLFVDLGAGRLTNCNLFRERQTIYVDGARFDGVNLVCDFAKKIPLKDGTVDAVLCSNVFEHLPDPQNCFDEIHRILKPDGECLILVPFFIKLHQEPFDFHRYTKHALKLYAERSRFAGTRIVSVGGFSNILGTVLKTAINNTSNKIKKMFLLAQLLIWKVLRRLYDDDEPNETYPQGYAVYLKK